ncbi:MAG: hypothetical protein M1820_009952 [Bogoriella megaspora]|nr:MAG: hypothetical protein M1820_009952 [Bogoriella megaspora]
MEVEDTFTQLPIQIDPQTKAISTPSINSSETATEIDHINALNRAIVGLSTPNSIPPPPVPVDPKRGAAIGKLRESGNAALKKGQNAEAIRLYTYAIDASLSRPGWEPAGLIREEASALYSNRAQAHMGMQAWPEGSIDAECSLELKGMGNVKGWWRKGRCLMEMGRPEEARDYVQQGLEFDPNERDLLGLLGDIEKAIQKRV